MKTNVAIVRDHSYSMRSLKNEALVDYNMTVASIKETSDPRDTLVSVIECGIGPVGAVNLACRPTTVSSMELATQYSTTGGSTPLFDSVAKAIDTAQMFSANDTAYLVLVITDGEDNSSKRESGRTIAANIQRLQSTGRWTFAFRVPKGYKRALESLGVPSGNILEWEQNSASLKTSTAQTTDSLSKYFVARKTGVASTTTFFADLSGVTSSVVKHELRETNAFDLYHVPQMCDGMEISDFCKKFGPREYTKGSALYQLTKIEKQVQDYKTICIRNQKDGKLYSGSAARLLLGVPEVGTVRLAPGKLGSWDVFIQNTAPNRKLVGGTTLLYSR